MSNEQEPIIIVNPNGSVIVGRGVTFDQALQALDHARRVLGNVVLRAEEPAAPPTDG